MTEHNDFPELLKRATPELPPEAKMRAMQAMTEPRSARGLRWRARVAVVAAAVLVVLVGVLATPSVKSRRARESWGQAFATLQAAQSMHMLGYVVVDGDEYDFEEWYARDGFYRCELRQKGSLSRLWMMDGETMEVYPAGASTGSPFRGGDIHHLYLPRMLRTPRFVGTRRPNIVAGDSVPVPSAGALEDQLRSWLDDPDRASDLRLTTRREQTPQGEERRVLELSGSSPTYITMEGGRAVSNPQRDTFKVRVEVDAATGRIARLAEDWLEHGKWVPKYRATDLEWEVPIPEHLRQVTPPEGHVLVRDLWWERLGQTVATEASLDWEVTLHAVDLDAEGALLLTLSRRPKPDSPTRGYVGGRMNVGVSATDSAEVSYELRNPQGTTMWVTSIDDSRHCFPGPCLGVLGEASFRVKLYRREGAAVRPVGPAVTATVTVTMDSPPRSFTRESVVFRDLPLPPRSTGDPWQDAVEIVDY